MKKIIIITLSLILILSSSVSEAGILKERAAQTEKFSDLVIENQENRARINTPETKIEPKRKVLIFEKRLAHKDDLITIKDCPLVIKDLRGSHALYVGGVISAGYPNVELYTMHMTIDWMPVIDWCIENDIKVISMSIASHHTEEREKALKKYVDWGGIITAASGNWNSSTVSYPASSKYSIAVSATNTEDSNGSEIDITVDSFWSSKRYNREDFASFSGTSGAQPVVVPVALRYQNANPEGNLKSFRSWLGDNSTTNIGNLDYTHSFGKLEEGENYFIYPDKLIDLDTISDPIERFKKFLY